jgi:dihydrolipoamide dehydrogenase
MNVQTRISPVPAPQRAHEPHDFDVAIIGAGTAGMAAYREASRHTHRIALIDGGPLGTTCARVGCMPSKLLIAAAEAAHAGAFSGQFGVHHGAALIDGRAVMQRIRRERDRFLGFVEQAVHGFEHAELIGEHAQLQDNHRIRLSGGRLVTARSIVIATGSSPYVPPALYPAGDRLIVNDDVFAWHDLPRSAAVFGTGVIGIELGQALHRLGVRVRLFARGERIGPLTDPVVLEAARQAFGAELAITRARAVSLARVGDEVAVRWGDAAGEEERFDYIIAASGRRPNLRGLGLENTSIAPWDTPLPPYDPNTGRIGLSNIYMAGDVNGERPLLHEAADEGRIAGENAAFHPESVPRVRRTPLGIVFSDPQIALAGASHADLVRRLGSALAVGEVSFADQGRARVMGVNRGHLRVYAERESGRLLGAEMVGPAAEHLAHLLAWAVESGLTVERTLQMPFYHPVLEEGVRTALRDLNQQLVQEANPALRQMEPERLP